MRKWGIVITAFYALVIVSVLVPAAALLVGLPPTWSEFVRGLGKAYGEWMMWVPAGILICGEALLLFLSVDTTQKRLKPRAHLLVSCAVAGILTALLAAAVIWSLGLAAGGQEFWGYFLDEKANILAFWGALWMVWGVVFYIYLRNSSEAVTRVISWLLRGSVLELLIVIPCHVIVRRRHDCSAPLVTSFGITTGIAIMLLSFGPSVLFLYKKRMDEYRGQDSRPAPIAKHIATFEIWRFFRSYVVPPSVLVALFSILFGGALLFRDRMPEAAIDAQGLNDAIARSLLAASLLMLCHAVYLAVMTHHLVYQHPIEEVRWVSLAYAGIVLAYAAHAGHTYLEATGRHVPLEFGGWSSGAFAVTYLVLAVHGIREHQLEPKSAAQEAKRETEQLRARWLWKTDVAICAFATLMFLKDSGLLDWGRYLAGAADAVVPTLLKIPVVRELYEQATPKDITIVVALSAYLLAKIHTRRRLRAAQTKRNSAILSIQTVEPNPGNWTSIRQALPKNALWLDLACGQGKNLRDLLQPLYDQDMKSFPSGVIFLDKDEQALKAAKAGSPTWWPQGAKQDYRTADMDSAPGQECQQRCNVIHMGHVAYETRVAKAARNLLRMATPKKLLLVRFTSGVSFYRVISSARSTAAFRPYAYHHIHQLLLADLRDCGWTQVGAWVIGRYCDISTGQSRGYVTDWCDVQYGELSGDIIERYLAGMAGDGEGRAPNSDRLVLLRKS